MVRFPLSHSYLFMLALSVAATATTGCLYVETTGEPGPERFRLALTCDIAMSCVGIEPIEWTVYLCDDRAEAVRLCVAESDLRDCECAVLCEPSGLCGD